MGGVAMDFVPSSGKRTKESRNVSPGAVVMPFGKYQGRTLGRVPRGYLEWTLSNLDLAAQPELREAIRARLGFDRHKQGDAS
jgi:putative quorum-sensing-regulated virulence factor